MCFLSRPSGAVIIRRTFTDNASERGCDWTGDEKVQLLPHVNVGMVGLLQLKGA